LISSNKFCSPFDYNPFNKELKSNYQKTHLENHSVDENRVRVREAKECGGGVGCSLEVGNTAHHRGMLSIHASISTLSLARHSQRAFDGGYVRSPHASCRVHEFPATTALCKPGMRFDWKVKVKINKRT
jgi:hypothetical protein